MDSQKPPSTPAQITETAPAEAPSVPPPAPPSTPPTTPPSSSTPQITPPSTPPETAVPASPPPPQTPAPSGKKSTFILPILGFIIVAIGFVFLALWYYQSQQKQTAVQASNPEPSITVTKQKIVVGIDPTYQPMEFLENGKLTGYDVDLANFIGKELGAQIEFKQIVFDDLFSALEKKQIDIIISTVTVTDERKQKYDFSDPYLQGGQVILTKKENTTITSTLDLKGKKIGVQKGTTLETEALKYTSDNFVIRYPDFVQATAALVKGEVDAIFADLPGAKGITIANPTLKIASDPFTKEPYAIVFRKGDPSITEINKALSKLRIEGILADLKQQWLDP